VWLFAAAVAPLSAQDGVPVTDRAPGLIGTWQCESIQHSNGTWSFERNPDDSIRSPGYGIGRRSRPIARVAFKKMVRLRRGRRTLDEHERVDVQTRVAVAVSGR